MKNLRQTRKRKRELFEGKRKKCKYEMDRVKNENMQNVQSWKFRSEMELCKVYSFRRLLIFETNEDKENMFELFHGKRRKKKVSAEVGKNRNSEGKIIKCIEGRLFKILYLTKIKKKPELFHGKGRKQVQKGEKLEIQQRA